MGVDFVNDGVGLEASLRHGIFLAIVIVQLQQGTRTGDPKIQVPVQSTSTQVPNGGDEQGTRKWKKIFDLVESDFVGTSACRHLPCS